MAPIEIIRPVRRNLRELGLDERWLEQQLESELGMLGPEFQDAEVLQTQRQVESGGRLDMLVFDRVKNRRYVVEIMLGALDESHVVRTIEYWDIERRRYPGHDHVAVIVAEEIGSRFLNVLSIMAGNVPLIAIQLNALDHHGKLILHFAKVLSLLDLREDDATSDGGGSDRSEWEKKSTPEMLKIVDDILQVIRKWVANAELNYLVHYVGLRVNGVSDNFVTFHPKKKFIYVSCNRMPDGEAWEKKMTQAGWVAGANKRRGLWVRVSAVEVQSKRNEMEELLQAAANSYLAEP